MKWHKLLITTALLIIMHYIEYMLFYKGIPRAGIITAAAGVVCGGICGESKFMGTAVNTVITLVLNVVMLILLGRLKIYEFIMFPYGMTEENYLSTSNRGAAGFLILFLLMVTVGSFVIGAFFSWIIRRGNKTEDQR